METVTWTNSDGYVRRALVTPAMKDAPEKGVPVGLDVRLLDWEGIQRDLNNALQREGLLTWDDVQRSGDTLRGVILGVMRGRLIALYRGNE